MNNRNLCVYALLAFVMVCKNGKHNEAFPLFAKSESFSFSYGSKAESPSIQAEGRTVIFEPELRETDTEVCFHSHPRELEILEWGPVVKLCFAHENDSSEILKSAISDLKNSNSARTFQEAKLKTLEGSAELKFFNSDEIEEIATNSEKNILILGDKKIHEKILRNSAFQPAIFISTYGKKETALETSFAARYPTYVLGEKELSIFFPPNNLDVASDSEFYAGFSFANENSWLINRFKEFANEISIKNEKFRNNCTGEIPKFTEFSNSSDFPFKRFLEFQNTNQEKSICLESFSIESSCRKTEFTNQSGFLFPGSVKMIVDNDSKLEGFQKKEFKWSDFKEGSIIRLTANQKKSEWILPEKFETNFGSDFFSLKNSDTLKCKLSPILYQKNSRVCADPGSEVFFEDKTNSTCNPDKFILTEANFAGIQIDNSIHENGKFLEFKYEGEMECDLSNTKIRIGKLDIPLSGEKFLIRKNEILVAGHPEYFSGGIHLIKRDLRLLSPYSSIFILNASKEKKVFSSLDSTTILLNKNASGDIHSVVFSENGFSFHQSFSSSYIRPDSKNNHMMSPGETPLPPTSALSAKINEINPYGTFKNGVSMTKDKFIEFKSTGEGTLFLEIRNETDTRKIIFPVTEKEKFTYIIKDKPECFSEIGSIQHNSFKLNAELTKLTLKNHSDGFILDQINFNPAKGQSTNSSSPNLRRSYSRTGYLNHFRNSTKYPENGLFSSCYEESEMSPGRENDFFPYLTLKNGPQFPFEYTLIKPISYNRDSINVRQYTIEPQSERNFEVPFNFRSSYGDISIPYENTLSDRGLIYQSIGNSEEIKLINREEIYIQAISPNPVNSQNEWILFCNLSTTEKDLSNFEIEDNSSTDKIVSYFKRKKEPLPIGLDSNIFSGENISLKPGQCGYLIDPDANSISLKPFGTEHTNIFTVESSSTIGNGISNDEGVDLYEVTPESRIHIHSYGNKRSHAPFAIDAQKGEAIVLMPGKKGETADDYEAQLW